MHWHDFADGHEVLVYMSKLAAQIRADKIDLGRKHYALGLAVGVMEAIFCDVGRIAAVEFGVAGGRGLKDLCKAAAHFRDELGMEIDIYGLDNAAGLPPPEGYYDMPELWIQGEFAMPDQSKLRAELPDFAQLVIGDIADTAGQLGDILAKDNPLGFVSVDVDFYSSARDCLSILDLDSAAFMPILPIYFDDLMYAQFTYNSRCGESRAIDEFNEAHDMRRIEVNPLFNIGHPWKRLHACHFFDHPVRSGEERLRKGFRMVNFRSF